MEDENGNLDMYITNAFERIFRKMFAGVVIGRPPESGNHKSGTKVDPINAAEFRKVYFEQGAQAALDAIIGWFGFQDIDAMARAMWGGKDASVIDRFHMVAGTQDGGTFTLAERSYVTSPARGANDNDRAPERIAA